MKTFFTHQLRAVLAAVTIGALLAVTYFSNQSFLKTPHAESAVVSNSNVSGWVWSLGTGTTPTGDNPSGPYSAVSGSNPGLGWVSFNSTSDASSQGYGVKVDTATKGASGIGNFSGNAWIGDMDPATAPSGSNTGWISFDRTETGNPPSDDPGSGSGRIAQVAWSTGKVTGWMRALSACDPSCATNQGAGANSGGWDGWIRLSDDGNPNGWAGNGVKITANKFSGYAWGGDVVGWVDFAPKIGGVSVGPVVGVPPCTAAIINGGGGTWGSCQALPSSTCVAPPATKFIAGGGIRVGACTTGGTTTGSCDVTVTCTVPVVVVPPPSGCNANPACDSGETPITCPSQCKVKFKQF
ncbi:MAG: hypothetical protein A2937_01330 [Candidatus Yonathbacteria bacterium RIFCSPLOWO2_01_FULL_47_33b]|uniref:Uncharacterized protein n=1 Tax=Candidatus Yonathbacteria bacterium RIFCSPLOWO2_01_FULL_47_33b TaxID=1802727 RepID=A0A1G2SH19_9BACT|nr:MAG: hypothetical protein A2937_01330 [Candidatus Yonathbacteria bacterium RIFCSPLOWO2_01_FULL_47_33b]